MEKVTESTRVITPETIIDQIATDDIPEFQAELRQLMDWGFLYCGESGMNAEPAWGAWREVDQFLEMLYEYKQSQTELLKVVGL
jgi:hypothetical protein